MGIEGSLAIALQTDSRRVIQVSIHSNRPVHASRVFHGKSVADTLTMIPMLFSICGTAQACAGVRACEQALGIESSAPVELIRNALVNMETLREHLWRILLDWPIFLGELPQKSAMTGLLKQQNDYRQLITGGNNPFLLQQKISCCDLDKLQHIVHKISGLLEQSVFAMPPIQWLEINSIEKLRQWFDSDRTLATRMLHFVRQQQLNETGRCQVDTIALLDTQQLYKELGNNDFIRQPQWHGSCRETSSLTRIESPLLDELRHQSGNGLLVRLVARLTEMAQLSKSILMDRGDAAVSYIKLDNNKLISGHGIGEVPAARGHLLHHVHIENEQIRQYQILAPTEWNFHPQGVVARSLATLQGDQAQIERQARLLINAIDPCVGFELSISDA